MKQCANCKHFEQTGNDMKKVIKYDSAYFGTNQMLVCENCGQIFYNATTCNHCGAKRK